MITKFRFQVFCIGLAVCASALTAQTRDAARARVSELINEALNCHARGQLAQAQRAAIEATKLGEAELGADDLNTAHARGILGMTWVDPEPMHLRNAMQCLSPAIDVLRMHCDKEDVRAFCGLFLHNLAFCYKSQGDMKTAEKLYAESLEKLRSACGPASPKVVDALTGLGAVMSETSRYTEAERCYNEALGILKAQPDLDRPGLTIVAGALASMYGDIGDYERAEVYAGLGVALSESLCGKGHPQSCRARNSLAIIYRREGRSAEALKLYEQNKSFQFIGAGFSDKDRATTAHLMASALMGLGRYDEAYQLQAHAIQLLRKNQLHVDGFHINNLGWTELLRGNTDASVTILREALEVTERDVGKATAAYANTCCSIAAAEALRGNLPQAEALLGTSNGIYEQMIRSLAFYGTQMQRLSFMQQITGKTDATIEFHRLYAPTRQSAAGQALGVILSRKGRVLDLMASHLEVLRRKADAATAARLDEQKKVYGEITGLMMNGGDFTRLGGLQRRAEEIEHELVASLGNRCPGLDINVAAVRERIPTNAALLEFMFYRPFDPKVPSDRKLTIPTRCAAYVLRRSGDIFSYDAGTGPDAEKLLARFRDELVAEDEAGLRKVLGELYAALLAPATKQFPGVRHWLIAPDGVLHFVPFAALRSPGQRYVAEELDVSLLVSGRDLLRMSRRPAAAGAAPVVYADPDYGPPLQKFRFQRLPGTRKEAELLRGLFSGTVLHLGLEASEARLQQEHSPRLLHLATHGYFLALPPAEEAMPDLSSLGVKAPAEQPPPPTVVDARSEIYQGNPLIRAGLALAGANLPRKDATAQDGILTALEVSALDLSQTEMVVLSACETGLGAVMNGSGVFGMRHAFALAGASTQVMTLWPVHDEATAKLMRDFYTGLKNGQGRAQALRSAQLAMLKTGPYRHPRYWSAFLISGDWRPLWSK